jgi:lysophospholipase L1-like esterase
MPPTSEVTQVSLGGQRVYDLDLLDADTLVMTVQGAPTVGWADLVVADRSGVEVLVEEAFSFQEPAIGEVATLVSFGASLAQGVQSGVPTTRGGLVSSPAQIARQLGLYHPLPLLVPGLFPPIGTDDIGEAPDCTVPDVERHVSATAVEIIPQLTDPETGEFGFHNARIDPDIDIRAVGVGGFELADVVHGVESNFALEFLAHLVLEPYGQMGQSISESQLERIVRLQPDVVLSPDLFGNDLIGAIVLGEDGIEPNLIPPLDEFEADLRTLLDALEATGAETFLATVPRPTLLPVTAERAVVMRESGATEEEVGTAVAAVEAMALAYNASLQVIASERPTVHVVDLAAAVVELEADGGLEVGGQWLTLGKMGGLLSLDGIHFSDVGYALVANLFLEAMQEALGWDVSLVDLEEVVAGDPFSPAALRAAGLEPDLCVPPAR